MTGEFISRESGDIGEREESGCDGRILGIMNSGMCSIRTGRRSTCRRCSLVNGWRSASRAGKRLKWRMVVGEQRASHA